MSDKSKLFNFLDEAALRVIKSCISEWREYQLSNPHDDFRFGMPDRFQLAKLFIKEMHRQEYVNISENHPEIKSEGNN